MYIKPQRVEIRAVHMTREDSTEPGGKEREEKQDGNVVPGGQGRGLQEEDEMVM